MTTQLSKQAVVAILAVLLSAAGAFAQEWRGMGRVGGKVVDESGKPLPGVTIKAALPRAGNRGPENESNAKGEWAVGGIAGGEWSLDFIKDGYETESVSVSVMESSRLPPMEIRLK